LNTPTNATLALPSARLLLGLGDAAELAEQHRVAGVRAGRVGADDGQCVAVVEDLVGGHGSAPSLGREGGGVVGHAEALEGLGQLGLRLGERGVVAGRGAAAEAAGAAGAELLGEGGDELPLGGDGLGDPLVERGGVELARLGERQVADAARGPGRGPRRAAAAASPSASAVSTRPRATPAAVSSCARRSASSARCSAAWRACSAACTVLAVSRSSRRSASLISGMVLSSVVVVETDCAGGVVPTGRYWVWT
jgi:hypothetical protein